MDISMSLAETGGASDGIFLGVKHSESHSLHGRIDHIFGELIDVDVNGPLSVKSLQGEKYYVFFKDNYSNYHRVFFIKQKNGFSKCLCMFLNEVLTAGQRVKFSDVMVARSSHVRMFVTSSVIVVRENRTVVKLALSMLSVNRLPKPMWALACENAVYFLNRTRNT
jgi:hypothetical protein